MLKATIGGVEYPIAQFKLRELIAAGPYLDEIRAMAQRWTERDAARALANGTEPPARSAPETAVDNFAFMRATLCVVLPGIQSATIQPGQPLSASTITLEFLESQVSEEEFAGLASLIPRLKEAAGIAEQGEPKPASPPVTSEAPAELIAPSPSGAAESSSSSSPSDAKAEAPAASPSDGT